MSRCFVCNVCSETDETDYGRFYWSEKDKGFLCPTCRKREFYNPYTEENYGENILDEEDLEEPTFLEFKRVEKYSTDSEDG